jgi:uncharacterized protein with FMN-binding domain
VNKSILGVGLCVLIAPAFAVTSADSATQTVAPILPDRGSVAVPVAVTYKDGSYTGPAVDAYWGKVQVQAVVENGQIASLTILKYPSDRRESQRINQPALPLLRTEVVKAQTARVNIISGATLTSQAFMRSLDAALVQAGGIPSAPGTPIQPGVTGRFPGGLGI